MKFQKQKLPFLLVIMIVIAIQMFVFSNFTKWSEHPNMNNESLVGQHVQVNEAGSVAENIS